MPYPPITALPQPPQRNGTQTPQEFSNSVDAWFVSQLGLQSDLNTFGSYLDATAITIDEDKVAAAASAAAAKYSEQVATSAANFAGEWSALTGPLTKGNSVYNDGALWALLIDLPDVTVNEPSPSNSDWIFLSGTRWVNVSSDILMAVNAQYIATAIGSPVSLTLPSFAAGDFFVIANDVLSDDFVRIVNASSTITGGIGAITAGDNLTINAGTTVHLVAISNNQLRVV